MTTATKIVNEVTLDASANPNVDTTFIDKGTNENTAHDIHGNSGKDTWVSGPGQNNFDGGDGIDTASYIHSQSGVTVDLNVGFAFSDDGKITDNLSSVENVVGSKFADNLTGARVRVVEQIPGRV